MCQDNEMLTFLYLPTQIVLDRQPDNSYILPTNFRELIEIVDAYLLGSYEIFGNKIYVDDTNSTTSVTVRYNRYPSRISNATDFTPDIPVHYHTMYSLYAGMMAQINDEEPERYSVIKDAFVRAKSMMVDDMSKQKSRETRATGWTVVR